MNKQILQRTLPNFFGIGSRTRLEKQFLETCWMPSQSYPRHQQKKLQYKVLLQFLETLVQPSKKWNDSSQYASRQGLDSFLENLGQPYKKARLRCPDRLNLGVCINNFRIHLKKSRCCSTVSLPQVENACRGFSIRQYSSS